ncbi:hypothetical protein J4772_21895 [Cohnella sp. LGH]|uniref:Uncharacterized protein n=1 Tax=Cohnella phaseoli TaxID=456490 RepID=A0A3D9I424_9BACL|nr:MULTISPECIES: hypothetical protein [Cohnella]QTH40241.1 hypothetical protein J4772_21895 [Cohnella sp. LGH]RED56504.1 hypothetical protein DFP98_13962 [Cohnella phaseoli]
MKYNPNASDRRLSAPIRKRSLETAENGSMVQDFDDMKRLGEDMKRMKTEQELEEEGYVNDPIQQETRK